jgi:DNA-binding response OmpR family regulator
MGAMKGPVPPSGTGEGAKAAVASTIVIAREDLSIPGSERQGDETSPDEAERHFFDLLRDNRPDVIVLDLGRTQGRGIEAIRKIREQSGVPILAVCASDDPRVHDYRIAGAAECLLAPIDITQLNSTLQHIIRLTRSAPVTRQRAVAAFSFAGATYRPGQDTLSGPADRNVRLTTSESDLLTQLLNRPWAVCTRAEIVDVVYGKHPPGSDRAIDVLVNRLRKKLASACGPSAENLIKTEFRRGYKLVVDVTTMATEAAVEETLA